MEISIIIDRSSELVLVRSPEVVVSPLCGGQPPPLRLKKPFIELFSRALWRTYGVKALGHLADQAALGLSEMDPVLFLGQLSLEDSYAAFLLPYRGEKAECISAYPTPALAALAVLSSEPRSIAVDFRWNTTGMAEVLEAAAHIGADLQIITSSPPDAPGVVYVSDSVPSYVRRRLVGSFRGHVDAQGRRFEPVLLRPTGGKWAEVDYKRALERVAEALGLRLESLEEISELGFLAYKTLFDLGINAGQLGYLAKWGLLEPIAGGFRAGGKLLYLMALRISPS
ncbi:MAG: hypothetical protein ABWJ97_00290 [Thermoproteus sp.]